LITFWPLSFLQFFLNLRLRKEKRWSQKQLAEMIGTRGPVLGQEDQKIIICVIDNLLRMSKPRKHAVSRSSQEVHYGKFTLAY
jgi:hypothetical protein